MDRAKLSKMIQYFIVGCAFAGVAWIVHLKPMIERRAVNFDKKIIQNAIEIYYSNNSVLPESLDFLVGAPKTVLNDWQINISEWEYSAKDDGYSLTYLNSKL